MAATLVVEDGTGHTNSNSYITLAEFLAYWELRNDADVAVLDDADAISGIVQGAQYLDFAYVWDGDRYSTIQAMSWPRVIFFDRDMRAMYAHEIPQRIKDAQCELAREAAINGPLRPSIDRGGRVQSESVGPLSVTYFADASSVKQFPLVDLILADLIRGGGGNDSLTTEAVLS